jgi:hypothetical protein
MNATISNEVDRVRRHTSDRDISVIDEKTRDNIRRHATVPSGLDQRIAELEREWDVERTLEANASTLALTGAVLGTTVNKQWFWLTGGVLTFLFQHATSGWCPPLPVLRKLGVRTQSEIDQERYALKAVRGDFGGDGYGSGNVEATLGAVSEREQEAVRREPDRVRRYTTTNRLAKLDQAMARRVGVYASQPEEVISERIDELYREWSIERYLQINVAAVGLTTAALAVGKHRNWGFVTAAGLAFFLFHAVEGFDPPLPLMRKAGIRSRAEINREIYALKILRGDFDDTVNAQDEAGRVEAAMNAVGI